MISPRVRAALAYVAAYAAVGSMLPYLPLYYRSLGFNLAEVGSILALGALVGLLASPSWGALSDRLRGSPKVLVAAVVTALGGTAVLALSTSPLAVLAGAALLGAGIGGFNPIIDARALETVGADRSRFGPLRAWGSFSYIIAVLASGFLVDRFGLRSVFATLTVSLVATAVVATVLRPVGDRPVRAASPLRDAGRLFGPRGLGVFLLGAFLTWLGMSAVLTYTPIRFSELGAGASVVGLGGAIAAGVEVPLMLRFPALAARWGSHRLLIAGSVFTAARAIVAAFATDPVVLLAASVFGGLGYAFFAIGGTTYVSEHVPPQLAATAQGIFQGVGNSLAQVTAALAGGAVAALAGVVGLFALSAVVGIAAAVTLGIAVRRGVDRAAEPPGGSAEPPGGAAELPGGADRAAPADPADPAVENATR